MSTTRSIEASGQFRIPEVSVSLPGILRISNHGEVTLSITYLSPRIDSIMMKWALSYEEKHLFVKLVLGEVQVNGEYSIARLRNCQCIKSNIQFDQFGMSMSLIYRAQFCLIGAKIDDNTEVSFSEIDFSVNGIDEWIGSRIDVKSIPENDNQLSGVSIDYKPPRPIIVHLENDMNMEFCVRWTTPSLPAVNKAQITQSWYIRLKSAEPRTLETFLGIVSKIQNFLYFALDQITQFKFVRGYKEPRETDGSSAMKPIDIYYKPLFVAADGATIQRFRMLFTYGEIKDNLGEILNRWIVEHTRHDSSFSLYFYVKSGIYLHLETQFLSLVQGIESMHRNMYKSTQMPQDEFDDIVENIVKSVPEKHRLWIENKLKYANEISLRRRLVDMMSKFGDLYGGRSEIKELSQSIVTARNYLTHHDDSLKKKSAMGQDLLVLREKLGVLFQLQMLLLAGIDVVDIHKIAENANILRKLGKKS